MDARNLRRTAEYGDLSRLLDKFEVVWHEDFTDPVIVYGKRLVCTIEPGLDTLAVLVDAALNEVWIDNPDDEEG